MTLNKWLANNYQELEKAASAITKYHYPDNEELLHETILYLYDYKLQDKLLTLIARNQLLYFVVSIMKTQYNSGNSYYHKKYRKSYSYEPLEICDMIPIEYPSETEGIEKSHMMDYIVEVIDAIADDKNDKRLNWYDVELYKLYVLTDKTFDTLNEETDIARVSIYYTIKKVREVIKLHMIENSVVMI